jgi:hypothetical protein
MEEVSQYKNNQDLFPCSHESKYLNEMNQNFVICFNCSSIIHTNESGKKIFPVKPRKYNVSQETATPIFLSMKDNHRPHQFINAESYLKIRTKIVKKMKVFAQNFNLTKKTFFLSLEYFDRICSRAAKFNYTDFLQTALIRVVLAAKFQDDHQNVFNAKLSLGASNNYTKDELYVLQLLNYDLYTITSYDIVMDIMHTGFMYSDENFSLNKMNVIYQKVEKMLYFFTEKKYYIEMTPIEIAISVIGFIREALGLVAYNNIIKQIFMTQVNDFTIYSYCLSLFKKCFQIQEESNHMNFNNNNKSINDTLTNNKNCFSNISNNNYNRIYNLNAFSNRYINKNILLKEEEK